MKFKFKWRLWSGPTFAVVIFAWLVLAYIFMWPPVVREFKSSSYPCVFNLRQLDGATDQWALEHGKHNGDPVTFEDLKPYLKLGSHGEIPAQPCQAGGIYSVTVVGAEPTCSFGTNSLIQSTNWIRIRRYGFYYQDLCPRDHMLP